MHRKRDSALTRCGSVVRLAMFAMCMLENRCPASVYERTRRAQSGSPLVGGNTCVYTCTYVHGLSREREREKRQKDTFAIQ